MAGQVGRLAFESTKACNRRVRSRWTQVAVEALIVVAVVVAYLAWPSAPAPVATNSGPAPRVLFDGCVSVTRGPVCHVDPNETVLRLWVEAEGSESVRVERDGVLAAELPTRIVDGGVLVRVPVATAATIDVRIDEGAAWRLDLVAAEREPTLARAEVKRRSGDFEEALALLTPLTRDERAEVRARAIGAIGRIAFSKRRTEEGLEHLKEAIALDEANGLISDEARDRFALAYWLKEAWRFSEVQTALHSVERLVDEYPGARSQLAYYDALANAKYGDLGGAQARLHEATRFARRLGQEQLAKDAASVQVSVLLRLGRYEEVARRLERLAENLPQTPGCDRANALNNIGYYATTNARAGVDTRPLGRTPIEWLREAQREFETACTSIDADYANTLQNLALEHVRGGELDEAKALLERVEKIGARPSGHEAVHRRVIHALVALLEGRPEDALVAYDWLERFGRAGDSAYHGWLAGLGRGRALVALGRRAAAIESLTAAEACVDRALVAVPLGDGRYRSAATYIESAMLLTELLLEAGRTEEAARVVRTSRRRGLASLAWIRRMAALSPKDRTRWYAALAAYRQGRRELEERATEDWHLSERALDQRTRQRSANRRESRRALQSALSVLGTSMTELAFATPRPDEVLLVLHRATTGHFVFAIDTRGVEGAVAESPERLAAVVRAMSADAEIVRVRPASDQLHLDFGAMFDTGSQRSSRVEYFLDLANPDAERAPDRIGALVVADPSEDLQATRSEGAIIRRAWAEAGYEVTLLAGREASFAAVRSALEQRNVRHFHYAGHASFSGTDGVESGLELANGARLTVTDVLALERVPTYVTLSGCETGRAVNDDGAGLNLASAFLVAGAERAIASTRAIDDEATVEAFRKSYRSGDDRDAVLRAGFRAMGR